MRNIEMNEYLKMEIDEVAPILYTKVLEMPEGSNHLGNFCEFHQSTLINLASKRGGIAYSICDTSSLQPYSFDLLINFYFRFVRKSKQVFQNHKIFVLPKLGTSVDVSEILKLVNGSSIYFFDSIEEARKSVYDDWTIYNKSKLVHEVVF